MPRILTTKFGIPYGWNPLENPGTADLDLFRKIVDAIVPDAYGKDEVTTTGLTFGYRGGVIYDGTTYVRNNGGTVALSASATNYVELTQSNTVAVNTTSFTPGNTPLHKVTTAVGTISTYEDWRPIYVGGMIPVQKISDPAREKILFSQIADATVSSASYATTLGAGTGTLQINQNPLIVGSVVEYKAAGVLNLAPGHTLSLQMKLGATVINVLDPYTPLAEIFSGEFSLEAYVVFRSVGASASVQSFAKLSFSDGTYEAVLLPSASATVDTTSALSFDFLVKQGGSGAPTGSSFLTTIGVVERGM